MQRGWMWLGVVLVAVGLVVAWKASEVGIEQTFAAAYPSTGAMVCGSLVRPIEEPRSECRSVLDGQMVETLGLFYLAEVLLLAAAWLVVVASRPARTHRWSDVVVGVAVLVVSPLLLLPGHAAGFTSGWGEPTTTVQVLLLLGALPVPLAMAAFWSRRPSLVRWRRSSLA